jgi:disulfide bond formation protein DsbB
MKLKNINIIPLAISLYSFFLFSWSLIAQLNGMHICSLCIVQRYIFLACGIFSAFAIFSKFKRFDVINVFASSIGIIVSSYQIWLSFNPLYSCGMPFNIVLQNFGFINALQSSLVDASCSKLVYLFGINIPIWALVAFSIILALSVIDLRQKSKIN